MDFADRASEQQQRFENQALLHRRQVPDAPVTGICLHCGEPQTEAGRRWCDVDCRDEWERRASRHL